jgi:hypothetical protein
VQVNAGKNTAIFVKMTTVTEVTTWADLVSAVDGNPDPAHPDREEIIIVKNDLTADSTAMINRKITIITDNPAGVKILRDPAHLAQFFYLWGDAYLTLGRPGDSPRRLAIDGNKAASITDVNKALVTLYHAGTLIMNDGVHLTGNYHNYVAGGGAGGAVEMTDGTFIMNGGEGGDGVFFSGGPFTMTAGTITGNHAPSGNCGGFYLYNTGNTVLPANVQSLITGNTASSSTPNFYNNNNQNYTTVGGTGWTSTGLGWSMGW